MTWLLKFVPIWAWIVVGSLAVSGVTYWHLHAVSQAKKAGIEQDKKRSDGVIAKMVEQHSEALGAANAKADATSAMLEKVKQGAQDALKTANAQVAKFRSAFSAIAGERDRLRDDLARAIVTGGVQASDDSVSACRDRADRSAKVLQESLRVSAVCAGDATDEVARGNALYESWLQLERATGM